MKRKVRKKKKKGVITANVAGTKFEIGECLPSAALFVTGGKTALAENSVEFGEVIIFYVMDF